MADATGPTPREVKYYGRRADLPDPRDYRFEFVHPALTLAPLPTTVDLRDTLLFSQVYDQGALGSCVANATAAAYNFESRRQGHRSYTPARLALYFWSRTLEGTVDSDAGCEIRTGVKVLATMGAPHEALWEYKIAKFTKRPTQRVYADGVKHEAVTYARVANDGSDDELAHALAGGFPVIIGITVCASFESDATAATGVVPVPAQGERVLGGHCMLAIGYTTDASGARTYLVRNSWGVGWGDAGHCYIPAAYLIDAQLAGDFWLLSRTV